MNEVREKLSVICLEDGDRTRDIFARALPPAEVDDAVRTVMDHVRAIPDALAFLRQRAYEWEAPALEREVTGYLTEPMEPLPETLYGAYGYLDDAYLAVGAATCVDEPARQLCWGSLDSAATQALRANQGRVRSLLHPDVAAFQDAMLSMLWTSAEEARRKAARQRFVFSLGTPGAAQRSCATGFARGSGEGPPWINQVWNAVSGVYASLR